MREIKFRGFGHHRGMVYDLVTFEGTSPIYKMNCVCDVLMQFTGLHDKNGKEIYEGDILTHNKFDEYYICKFEDGQFSYKEFDRHDKSYGNYYYMEQKELERYCEIIGNIYENHELLEKQ